MKTAAVVSILAVLICLLPARSYSQSLGFGIGGGIGRGGMEIIKIGPSARAALRSYLKDEYQRQCPAKAKKLPDSCQQTKALYTSSNLPADGTHSLPQKVIDELGFIPPGTEYVQAGFVVYLIHLPRRIILDNVSAADPEPTSNIQWR
jgi:hypothetical protein